MSRYPHTPLVRSGRGFVPTDVQGYSPQIPEAEIVVIEDKVYSLFGLLEQARDGETNPYLNVESIEELHQRALDFFPVEYIVQLVDGSKEYFEDDADGSIALESAVAYAEQHPNSSLFESTAIPDEYLYTLLYPSGPSLIQGSGSYIPAVPLPNFCNRQQFPPLRTPYTHEFYDTDGELYFVKALGGGMSCEASRDPGNHQCPEDVRRQFYQTSAGQRILKANRMRVTGRRR